MQSCTARGVYTGLSKGARGILFPDNDDQRLAVKDRKDPEGRDPALYQERRKARFIEGVQDSLTNAFPQPGAIMKQGLRLGAELILIGLPEMPPIERRKICVGMKGGNNQGTIGMQHTVPFSEARQRRRHIGE